MVLFDAWTLGDGLVNVWDGACKKRLYQYARYPTSISALSFSADGEMLAVGSSYTYEEDDKEHPPDAVYVRAVNDPEVAPKAPRAAPQVVAAAQ